MEGTPEVVAPPVDENQRSISILQTLQGCDWFSQDREDATEVRVYKNSRDGGLHPTSEQFSIPDFFKAVDFFSANRDANVLVDASMQKPDGVVNVWTGPSEDRKVAVGIANYRVPQILEFAYQLARTQNATPQTQS